MQGRPTQEAGPETGGCEKMRTKDDDINKAMAFAEQPLDRVIDRDFPAANAIHVLADEVVRLRAKNAILSKQLLEASARWKDSIKFT